MKACLLLIFSVFLFQVLFSTSVASEASEVLYKEDASFNPIGYLPVLVIFFVTIAFSISVVLALTWAGKSGQFENLTEGSKTIFDEFEPIGQTTDSFPLKTPRKNLSKKTTYS